MTGTRLNLLSLLASGLALAVGVVLGAGPLARDAETRADRQAARLEADRQALREQAAGLRGELALAEGFVAEVGPGLTAGRLRDRSVVVVALPGAAPALVAVARKSVERAGASVLLVVRLTPTYVDPAQAKSPLEDLALRLVPPGVTFTDGATAIERVGTVLARAIVATDAAAASTVDQPSAELLAGLQELGALRAQGEPGRRAQLALVVAPATSAGTPGSPTRAAADEAVLGLASALDIGSAGAVVVGDGPAAARGGPLQQVRRGGAATEGVSTVDGAADPVGQVALVLALSEQAGDSTGRKAGHYGVGRGADSVLPSGADRG